MSEHIQPFVTKSFRGLTLPNPVGRASICGGALAAPRPPRHPGTFIRGVRLLTCQCTRLALLSQALSSGCPCRLRSSPEPLGDQAQRAASAGRRVASGMAADEPGALGAQRTPLRDPTAPRRRCRRVGRAPCAVPWDQHQTRTRELSLALTAANAQNARLRRKSHQRAITACAVGPQAGAPLSCSFSCPWAAPWRAASSPLARRLRRRHHRSARLRGRRWRAARARR